MRRIDEVVSGLTARGDAPLARILVVAAQAPSSAGAGYDVVIEVDATEEAPKARKRAAGDAAWAEMSEAWLADALAPYAARTRLVRVNGWRLLSRMAQAGLRFAAAEHLIAPAPHGPDGGEKAATLLGAMGFSRTELALPADRGRAGDALLTVASRGGETVDPPTDSGGPAQSPRLGTEPTAGRLRVLDHHVAFADGYASGRLRLAEPPDARVFVSILAGDAPVSIAEAEPAAGDGRELTFALWAAPELFSATERSLTVTAFAAPSNPTVVTSLRRPAGRRFVPEEIVEAHGAALYGAAPKEPFGVLVVAGPHDASLRAALESLAGEDAARVAHVWLDGDPADEAGLAANAETARAAGVCEVRAHGGRLGMDKLMIHALDRMSRRYESFLVIEDGCVLAPGAAASFRAELADAGRDASVLTIDGQSSGSGERRFGGFPAGGWAVVSARLAPLLPKLAYLYSLEEADFLAWAAERLAGDRASPTQACEPDEILRRRFDWAQALGLVAQLDGLRHAPAARRLVFRTDAARSSD